MIVLLPSQHSCGCRLILSWRERRTVWNIWSSLSFKQSDRSGVFPMQWLWSDLTLWKDYQVCIWSMSVCNNCLWLGSKLYRSFETQAHRVSGKISRFFATLSGQNEKLMRVCCCHQWWRLCQDTSIFLRCLYNDFTTILTFFSTQPSGTEHIQHSVCLLLT